MYDEAFTLSDCTVVGIESPYAMALHWLYNSACLWALGAAITPLTHASNLGIMRALVLAFRSIRNAASRISYARGCFPTRLR